MLIGAENPTLMIQAIATVFDEQTPTIFMLNEQIEVLVDTYNNLEMKSEISDLDVSDTGLSESTAASAAL